jgi:iron complex outermembrane receptor protein
MNYEAGWDRDIPDWNARMTLHVFHAETQNITSNDVPRPPGQPLAVVAMNIGSSRATGAEFSFTGHFGANWRWGLSYTPEAIEDNFVPGLSVANTAVDYQHTRPVHIVKGNLGWARGPWETDLYLQYQTDAESIRGSGTSILAYRLVPIRSFVTMDARIAYRLTDHLTLSVSGQNILDSPQMQTSAAAVERSVFVTLTLSN